MDPTTLVNLVKNAAPNLSKVLQTPSAKLAVAALGRAVTGDDNATPEEIATALMRGGAESTLQIKSAEESLFGRLNALGVSPQDVMTADQQIQAGKIDADDRTSARNRQIAMHDSTTTVLAYLVTFGFFITLGLLLAYPTFVDMVMMHSENDDLTLKLLDEVKAVVQTLVGVLGTAWISIIAYYFGSSTGSAQKSFTIAEAMPQKSQN